MKKIKMTRAASAAQIASVLGIIAIMAMIGFGLSACSDGDFGFFEPDFEEPVTGETSIVFDNTEGTGVVVVFNSLPRTEESKIVEIPAGKISKEFKWTAGSSVPFFLSYKLNLTGITDFTLNYIPEIGKDQIYMRIDAGKKNVVTIPALAMTLSSPNDSFLSNDSFIFIQNNASFSIQLTRGSNVLSADNFSDTGVNPGERAYYTFKNTDNRSVSAYQINESGRNSSFPASFNNFEPGRVYSFIYNGSSISLFSILEIKLANVASGLLDDPSNKTYVRFNNNNDFDVSVYTNFARNIKLTDVQALSQSDAVQTDPNISGAVYYPNYNIVIEGITIPYQGGAIVTRIDSGKTTDQPSDIIIPPLDDLDIVEFEKPLVNSVYIKIQNESIYSLSLLQGASDLIPQGTMSSIVNNGEGAFYIVNSGNISNYSLRRNPSTTVSFPLNLMQFESGRLYSFRYDGSNLVLLAEKPITLKQALAISPPENIHAHTLVSGYISINWDKAGSETSYKIYRSQGNTDNFELIGSSINTSYTDNDISGETHYYKLVSVKKTSESEMSVNYASALSKIPSLSIPSNLTASVQDYNSILLSWNPVEYASEYKIYQGNNEQDISSYLTTTSNYSYTVTGLEADTNYWFTVSALNNYTESPLVSVRAKTPAFYTVSFNSNGGSNVPSQIVQTESIATRPANPTLANYTFDNWYSDSGFTTVYSFSAVVMKDITLYAKWIFNNLIPPTGVNALAQSSNTIYVSWNTVAGVTGYKIYRSTSSSGQYSLIETTESTSFLNTGLSPSTAYYYRVYSYYESTENQSAQYSSVSATTNAAPPAVPLGLFAMAQSDSSIKLDWNIVAGAAGYRVFRSTNFSGPFNAVGTPTTNTFTDNGLTPNTTYYYQITAYNSAGSSEQSATASAATYARIGTINVANKSSYPSDNIVGVQIFRSSGTLVKSGDVTRNNSISWSDIPAGEQFYIMVRVGGLSNSGGQTYRYPLTPSTYFTLTAGQTLDLSFNGAVIN